jgi:hypothetical protein
MVYQTSKFWEAADKCLVREHVVEAKAVGGAAL